MKTKYKVTVGTQIHEGTLVEMLDALLPYEAHERLTELSTGIATSLEYLGAGDASFTIEIIEDYRVEDLNAAFFAFRACCRVKIGQQLLHAVSVASHNPLSLVQQAQLAIICTLINHITK